MNDKKILVVDDDAGIRESLKDLFSLDDMDCAVASSAEEGIAMAASENPDLVVTDLQLPDMSGYQLCQSIKRDPALRHLPVIMISGCFTEREDRLQGFDLGADDFFAKPFNPGYFVARVKNILRQSAVSPA